MKKPTRGSHNGKVYPQLYAQDDFVFFLHIPKTAGTAIATALQRLFAQEHILTHEQMNFVRGHDPSIFLSAQFFHGHFTYDVYAYRLPRAPNFILTFLRDPVAHYVSTYFHLKLEPTFIYDTRLVADEKLAREFHRAIQNSSMEDFFRHELADMFDNFQTRYLVRGLSNEYQDLSDPTLLPIAQRLLVNLPFFGLTERMQDSLRLLGSTMGAAQRLEVALDNVSRNKPADYALSATALNEIQRRTTIDRKLYAFASRAFADRFSAAEEAGALPELPEAAGTVQAAPGSDAN